MPRRSALRSIKHPQLPHGAFTTPLSSARSSSPKRHDPPPEDIENEETAQTITPSNIPSAEAFEVPTIAVANLYFHERNDRILNWALDGLDRLRNRGGFLIPPSVQAATDEFQENNDVPGLFVEDHCILGDGHKVQSSVLYERYVEWCKRNGHKASSSTRVADDWERLGFERTTINGKKYWKGLKVPELSYLDDSYSCAG